MVMSAASWICCVSKEWLCWLRTFPSQSLDIFVKNGPDCGHLTLGTRLLAPHVVEHSVSGWMVLRALGSFSFCPCVRILCNSVWFHHGLSGFLVWCLLSLCLKCWI